MKDSLPTTEDKMLSRKEKTKYYVHLNSKPKMTEFKIGNIIYNTHKKKSISAEERFSITKKKKNDRKKSEDFDFLIILIFYL